MPSESLVRYLEAASRERRGAGATRAAPEPFITISRQAGAGARAVAEALLAGSRAPHAPPFRRGWALFDDRLVDLVAGARSLRVSRRELADETFRTEATDWASGWIAGLSPQAAVVRRLFRVIRALALRGRVIIVGRGAGPLTRALPGGWHVRLVAPEDARRRHLASMLGVSEGAAARVMRERDRARAALVESHFHRSIDDPLLYHVVWNTAAVSAKVIAEATWRALEAREGVVDG